jgi:hypothetical protein
LASLKPPGEPDLDSVDTNYAKGTNSGTRVGVRMLSATIVAMDKAASSISFEAPNGWKYSRRVVDPTVFDQFKVGDKVNITWNTDLTILVE